jgi:hypothetical protein
MAAFNNLPPEVRNMMYEQLLMGESRPQHRDSYELAMFTVSKQLHNESSSYFYHHNDIVVDVPSATTETATILPPIADQYLRFMRRLTIHAFTGQANMPQTLKVATTIAALSGVGAHFAELNLLIESPLSHMMSSRVDDPIMHASHPITMAIRTLLRSNITKLLRIQLKNSWFAPSVARALQCDFNSQLEFLVDGAPVQNTSVLEKALTGRDLGSHLTDLGLKVEDVRDSSCGDGSSPRSLAFSLPSSLCSAVTNLDTFSVTSFRLDSDDHERRESSHLHKENDNAAFFTEDDIEEWSAFTQEEQDSEEELLGDIEDLDEDEDMEDVEREDIQAFMNNLEDVAHHVANESDVTYMTNFAPDLLLSRHHLAQLV